MNASARVLPAATSTLRSAICARINAVSLSRAIRASVKLKWFSKISANEDLCAYVANGKCKSHLGAKTRSVLCSETMRSASVTEITPSVDGGVALKAVLAGVIEIFKCPTKTT